MVRVVRTVLAVALAVGASVAARTGGVDAATGDPVLINAAQVSTTGTDPEYVELFGVPGSSLAGLSVIGIEGDAGSPIGAIDHRFDLPADAVIGDNGYFLLANATAATTYSVTPNFSIGENALENSSLTLALVETASITGTTAAAVGAVRDSVALTDGGAGDTFFFGAPVVGPDGANLPAGVRRATVGVDTDAIADWVLLSFSNVQAPTNVPTVGTGDGGGGNEPVEAFIHEVQGADAASPLVDDRVVVEGIVVGDQEGPSPALRGFFVQEEDADVDDDPATSEGIFVFNGNLDSVNVGDAVRVTGTVAEFNGLTELTGATTEVLATGVAMPTAAVIEFPVPAVAALEAYEGMLATLPQQLVISEYFNYDRFGEVVVALPAPGEARPMTPTAVFDPESPEAAARADLNLRSRITIDDGITTQNPETVIHPITRDQFTLTNNFRGGDTVSGLTGPIYFDFGLYRILPYGNGEGYDTYTRNPAPAAPEPVGGSLRVASMNTLNYFLTLDLGPDICGPQQTLECRGADDANELARQRVRLLNALEGLDADVIGLNEIENTPGVEPLADIAAGLGERFGAGTYDYIVAGDNSVVGSDAIKVGLIYRPAAVTPIGEAAVLDTPEFLNPNGGALDRNRAAVAQTFRDNATGEVFSVTINHLKSKGSACPEDGGTVGLSGNCDATRAAAAAVLAQWIAGNPTGVADSDWLIMGDLNSYDHEAPIEVLEGAGFTDLAKRFHGEYAYSYVFDGQSGYLDYSLASASILSQVTGMTDWHINADEPDIVDYDTSFKSNYQDSLFDPASPARASDHDAVVVGLQLASGIRMSARPSLLLLPLHQMVPIAFNANGARGTTYTVTPLSAVSSEADSGLGRFDQPNDVQLANGSLRLRAEVYGCPSRTYTIETQASGGGQVAFRTVTVTVPNLIGILLGCRR